MIVQHEAGALGEVKLVGEREAEVFGRGDHFGKPAQPAERGHAVAGRDRGAVGRRADDAADLAAGDERQRRLELILAAGLQHLGERHAGGVDVDQHAASRRQHRRRLGLGRVDELQRFVGTAQLRDLDRSQGAQTLSELFFEHPDRPRRRSHHVEARDHPHRRRKPRLEHRVHNHHQPRLVAEPFLHD